MTPPEVIVATPVLLLLHEPPVVASLSVIVDPTHTVEGPDMEGAVEETVIVLVAMHPLA